MLAFAYYRDFVVDQIDVKSAFLNMYLKGRSVCQANYLNHVFIIHKALYSLKQAP